MAEKYITFNEYEKVVLKSTGGRKNKFCKQQRKLPFCFSRLLQVQTSSELKVTQKKRV